MSRPVWNHCSYKWMLTVAIGSCSVFFCSRGAPPNPWVLPISHLSIMFLWNLFGKYNKWPCWESEALPSTVWLFPAVSQLCQSHSNCRGLLLTLTRVLIKWCCASASVYFCTQLHWKIQLLWMSRWDRKQQDGTRTYRFRRNAFAKLCVSVLQLLQGNMMNCECVSVCV